MLGHLTLFQQPSHPDNYITDLDLKIKFLSLNVWALELYSQFFNIFNIFNFWSLQFLKTSIVKDFNFEDFDFEDFIF